MSAALSIPSGALATMKRKVAEDYKRHLDKQRVALGHALIKVAGETAIALAERTFPSSMAIGITVKKVRSDVHKVYATPSKVFGIIEASNPPAARQFWHAMKIGDIARAREIVRTSGSHAAEIRIGGSLDPSLHEKSRNPKNGNVALAYPLQLCTKQEIAVQVKHTIAKIGKTASGWYAAADDLGANGNTVRWKGIGVHGKGGGRIRSIITPTSITIVLINNRQLARKHISPIQKARILAASRESLKREIRASVLSA